MAASGGGVGEPDNTKVAAMKSCKAKLERTNYGCYFSECACGWSGGVHNNRSTAVWAWEAHRDGTGRVDPIRPQVLFGPRAEGQA